MLKRLQSHLKYWLKMDLYAIYSYDSDQEIYTQNYFTFLKALKVLKQSSKSTKCLYVDLKVWDRVKSIPGFKVKELAYEGDLEVLDILLVDDQMSSYFPEDREKYECSFEDVKEL